MKANSFLKKVSKKLKNKLDKNIIIENINNIDKFISKIENKKIQLDISSCSIYFKNNIEQKNKIIKKNDPVYHLKSIKNKVEIKNSIKSHV